MKVLFVGLGSVGQRHLRNLITLLGENELEIYAYRARRLQRVLDSKLKVIEGEGLEERYKIKVVSDLESAFEQGVDAVFVCNPSSLHLEVVKVACAYSCPIFEEKPLAHTIDGVHETLSEIKRKELITYIGFQNRLHPCVQEARRLLDVKALGSIIAVDAELGEDITSCHPYEDYRETYTCRKELGGGVLLSQIHELDYLSWLFGEPETVYAVGGNLGELNIDVEDCVDILMRYNMDGRNVPVRVHEDFIQSPPVRRCKIVGTKGRVEFDLINSTLHHWDKGGLLVQDCVYEYDRNDLFFKEVKEFIESVASNKQTKMPLSEGLSSLKIALAAKDSLEKGIVITLGGNHARS